jgi:hypothetical protein
VAASISSEIMLAGPNKLSALPEAGSGFRQSLTEKEKPRLRGFSFSLLGSAFR